MDNLKSVIKNETIKKVEKYVSTFKPFEYLIDIYVTMVVQKEELEKKLLEKDKNTKGYIFLTQIISDLEEDIKNYEELLLIR